MKIRAATAGDVSILSELGARTFRDTFAADNTEGDMARYLASSFGVDIQARELAELNSAFLVADIDETAVGYARVRTDCAPDCVKGTRPMEIVRFYVDAPWIGRGVGHALMVACFDEAASRECDVVWLDVWERNARAIAFYSKWGFAEVGAQSFVLGDDIQRDLLMARQT